MILAKKLIKYFEKSLITEFARLDLPNVDKKALAFFLLELSKIAAGNIRTRGFLHERFIFEHLNELPYDLQGFLLLTQDKYFNWMDDLIDTKRTTRDMIEMMIRIWLCKKIIASLRLILPTERNDNDILPILNLVTNNLIQAKKVLDKEYEEFINLISLTYNETIYVIKIVFGACISAILLHFSFEDEMDVVNTLQKIIGFYVVVEAILKVYRSPLNYLEEQNYQQIVSQEMIKQHFLFNTTDTADIADFATVCKRNRPSDY